MVICVVFHQLPAIFEHLVLVDLPIWNIQSFCTSNITNHTINKMILAHFSTHQSIHLVQSTQTLEGVKSSIQDFRLSTSTQLLRFGHLSQFCPSNEQSSHLSKLLIQQNKNAYVHKGDNLKSSMNYIIIKRTLNTGTRMNYH